MSFSSITILFTAIVAQCLIGQVQIISGTSEPVLCDKPVDIVLAIDSSGSVSSSWNNSIDFSERLLSNFNIDNNAVRVGIIEFSMIANALIPLSSGVSLGKLFQVLENARYRPQNGETHTELALDLANKMFMNSQRPDSVPKVLVIITDGELTSGYYQTLDYQLRDLDALKVVRFVVTEGDAVIEGIKKLASKPFYEYIFDLTPVAMYSLYGTQSLSSSICSAKFSPDIHGGVPENTFAPQQRPVAPQQQPAAPQQQSVALQQQQGAPQQQPGAPQQQPVASQQQPAAPQQQPAAPQQQPAVPQQQQATQEYVGIPIQQSGTIQDKTNAPKQQPIITAQDQQKGTSIQYSSQQPAASNQVAAPQQAKYDQKQSGYFSIQASTAQQSAAMPQQQFEASQQQQLQQQQQKQNSQLTPTPASLVPMQQGVGNPKKAYPEEPQKQPFPALPATSEQHNSSLTIQEQKGNFIEHRVPDCNLNVTKVGCFNDEGLLPRPLPVNILQDKANKFSNGARDPDFNKTEWELFLPEFICRCANIARQRKYWTFGIQNYNECFSGNDEGRYDEDGAAEPTKCKNDKGQICDEKSEHCTGEQNVNFVYTILSPQHPEIVKIEYD